MPGPVHTTRSPLHRRALRLVGPSALGLLASGCVVYGEDVVYEEVVYHPVAVNHAPVVLDAEAGVYWDHAYHDDVWYFDAYVDDADGPYDVIAVWVDVWDEYRGVFLDSFELFPTSDPRVWYAEYANGVARLDPFYPGYTVDFVVYDSYEDRDWMTVWALTY